MKGLNISYLYKVALSVLLALQAAAISAGDIDAEIKKAYRRELIQEIKTNFESQQLQNKRLDIQVEHKAVKGDGKPVSYLSILGLIINDAMGRAEQDMQVRTSYEAGLISH